MISPGEGVTTTPVAVVRSDALDDNLRLCIERVVTERFGPYSAIIALDRRRWHEASSYPAEVLTARLASGEELALFFKDFGSSAFQKVEPRLQRDRELRVYRDVLADAGLGTPEYFGSTWDESRERYWLFLELVVGTPLAYCGFDHWIAAVGWLARLHGHCAAHPRTMVRRDFLLTHDANFFWTTARRAMRAVSSISLLLAERVDEILRRYASCVDVMASQRPTLVHGAFKPRHILVDAASARPRFCPVDWELAAAGSNVYDLAFLAHGLKGEPLERLLEAYRREAIARDLPLSGREEMRYLVDCFRLHRVLKALSGAEERALSEARVAKLVEIGEQLGQLVC